MTEELYALEADAARLSVAIHCIKECDPASFAETGKLDGWEQQQQVIAVLNKAKLAMNQKTRSLIRESLT